MTELPGAQSTAQDNHLHAMRKYLCFKADESDEMLIEVRIKRDAKKIEVKGMEQQIRTRYKKEPELNDEKDQLATLKSERVTLQHKADRLADEARLYRRLVNYFDKEEYQKIIDRFVDIINESPDAVVQMGETSVRLWEPMLAMRDELIKNGGRVNTRNNW